MTGEKSKWISYSLIVVLAAAAGFWLARDVVGVGRTAKKEEEPQKPRPPRQIDAPNPNRKATSRHPSKSPPDLRDILLGTPNERIVRFKNDAAYRRFLSELDKNGLRLLGRLDSLRALRIGFDELADLERLLGDDEESLGNYQVTIPDQQLPDVAAQAGAVGFGQNTLEWLGVTGDNGSWGEGVRIAVLDTGIDAASFPNGVREIDLISVAGEDPIPLHGHGTAVTSLLLGVEGVNQGLVPSADVLSIRIADEGGNSNSFLLAEGIVRAVDEGAQIINISMGSYGDSALVQDAVAYALESNVSIVAAAGNEGLDTPAFPAAYEGVVSVGAVEANGQHLDFSNTGEDLSMAAPGYGITSAWPDDQFTSFSGTSASAPIAAGTIAAAMSEFDLPVANAGTLVTENLNAAGAPGEDPYYGEGIVDIGRVMNSETPGIYDAAIASNHYVGPTESDPVGRLQVTVENRGTETISNTTVDVTVGDSIFPMNVPNLRPGETQVLTLPVTAPTTVESVPIRSALNLNGNINDIKPSNDVLVGEIVLIAPEPETAAADPLIPSLPVVPLPDTPTGP